MKRLFPILIVLAAAAEPEVRVGAGWAWSPYWDRGWGPRHAPCYDSMDYPYDGPYGRYPMLGYEARMKLLPLDRRYAKLGEGDSGMLSSNIQVANPTNAPAWDRDFRLFLSAPRREKKDE